MVGTAVAASFCYYNKHQPQKQFRGGNGLFSLYFEVTVCHLRGVRQEIEQEIESRPQGSISSTPNTKNKEWRGYRDNEETPTEY